MISKKIMFILSMFTFLLVSLAADIRDLFVNLGADDLYKILNKMCGRPQHEGIIRRLYYSTVRNIQMCRDGYIEEVRKLEKLGGKDFTLEHVMTYLSQLGDHLYYHLIEYILICFFLYATITLLVLL